MSLYKQPKSHSWNPLIWLQYIQVGHIRKKDSITAEIGDDARWVVVGKNIIQIGQINVPIWLLILVLVSLVGILGNATYNYFEPLFTPVRMPDGSYNVAVATFGVFDAKGQLIETPEATALSKSITRFISGQKGVLGASLPGLSIEVWGPDNRIGIITKEQIAQQAKQLNANIVIYGSVTKISDNQWELEPNFYISAKAISNKATEGGVAELIGEHELGTSIKYYNDTLGSGEAGKTLKIRLDALIQVISGLIYESRGTAVEINKAIETLHSAESSSQWIKANDHTGQEVFYLFLGIAYLGYVQQIKDIEPSERIEKLQESIKAFSKAIDLNPTYARPYNGLGFSLIELAVPLTGDTCAVDWRRLSEAEQKFLVARDLAIKAKLPSGKASFGLGQVYLNRGYCLGNQNVSWWDKARSQYLDVAEEFSGMNDPAPSMLEIAEGAYTGLAIINLYDPNTFHVETDLSKLRTSVNYFQKAFTLIDQSKMEISQRYKRESIPFYLMALCANGEGRKANQMLNEYISTWPTPDSIRSEVLKTIGSSEWEKCINEKSE